LGLPATYVAGHANQLPVLEAHETNGFRRFLGDVEKITDEVFVEDVEELLEDRTSLLRRREPALSAIDGNGAEPVGRPNVVGGRMTKPVSRRYH
jgi:hypothetical protein